MKYALATLLFLTGPVRGQQSQPLSLTSRIDLANVSGRIDHFSADLKEIQVADLVKNAVIAKWPVTSALKNYPMALDEAHHRLLIGCRKPARMLVIDTETGKQTASVEIVGDTDDLFYDAARSRVYVIGGQGFVDVFEQKDADHYNRIGHYMTATGARAKCFLLP